MSKAPCNPSWFHTISHSILHPLVRASTRVVASLYPAAKRWQHRFNGGVYPQYHKSLSLQHPIKETLIPKQLILPIKLSAHQKIDLKVSVGDSVQKNQLLMAASKTNKHGVIVPIHAPTSGIITAIKHTPLTHPSGLDALSIILEPDGKNQSLENTLNINGQPPGEPQALKTILLNAGIVGLGGAGFPTYAKIPATQGQIQTLIINGAECEPFITCDDLLMQTQAAEVVQGAIMVAHALGIPKIVCAIESNKPVAIQAINHAAQHTIVTVQEVETVYPMGGEKQLLQELTGIEIPAKTHAIDSGLLVFNVATCAAIFKAVTQGEPLTQRLVTVTGLGLKTPYNMHALIGTPFSDLAELAQPKTPINYPLIMGGPMMGFKVKTNQVPVIKTTNCILANPPEPEQLTMPCIRCGECMEACPINLLPQQLFWHSQAHEFEKVEKLNVFDCIECGCCSYVCPSRIPLVQYYRHAKSAIKEQHAEQQAIELAKQRHEFRLARIEREKQERDARLKAKKEAVKQRKANASTEANAPEQSQPSKKSSAAAAARAAAAKRAAASQKATGSSNASQPSRASAREKAIETAKKQAAAQVGSKKTANKDPNKNSKASAAKKAAAMAAAKRRAKQKKEHTVQEAPTVPSSTQAPNSESSPKAPQAPTSAEEKRKKAIEAAKKRTAERKARQTQQETH